jgi:hypothetical protein
MLLGTRIADVIDIEAQRLRQIIEAEQLQLRVVGGLDTQLLLLLLLRKPGAARPKI